MGILTSRTSPLKNSVDKKLGIEVLASLEAVNQVRRVAGQWEGVNTDGEGFVIACRHIGLNPEGRTLRLREGVRLRGQ